MPELPPPAWRRRSSRTVLAAVLAGGVLVAASCSSSTPNATQSTAVVGPGVNGSLPPPSGRALPPNDLASLQQLYDPLLAPLGMKLTRAALVDRSNGGYETSDTGTHLALYVRRTSGTDTPDSYANSMWTIAALFTPEVFSRWPGLQTYDVCQEVTDAPDPQNGDEPPTATQTQATRDGAAKLDWKTGSLVDLLAAARSGQGIEYMVRNTVKDSPTFADAERAALQRIGQAPPGSGTIPPVPSTTDSTAKRVYR